MCRIVTHSKIRELSIKSICFINCPLVVLRSAMRCIKQPSGVWDSSFRLVLKIFIITFNYDSIQDWYGVTIDTCIGFTGQWDVWCCRLLTYVSILSPLTTPRTGHWPWYHSKHVTVEQSFHCDLWTGWIRLKRDMPIKNVADLLTHVSFFNPPSFFIALGNH